ncbi:MAG: OB-fold domain-containing protein [Actinomycetota bacterium]
MIGPDEDVVTMAVAAGRAALDGAPVGRERVDRIVLVSRTPDFVEGSTAAVIARGMNLPDSVPVEERLGGPADALDALTAARPGTLVVGVDVTPPAVAAAAIVGEQGTAVTAGARTGGSLPMRVHATGRSDVRVYDDPRLLRERGWHHVMEQLGAADGAEVVCGIPPKELSRLPHSGDRLAAPPALGAAAPLVALADLVDGGLTARLVAVEGQTGLTADVRPDPAATRVTRDAGPRHTAPESWDPAHDAEIPLALPAYERAFDAKIGLIAARCECGTVSYPPRTLCIECGSTEATAPVALPRTGEVYTGTTVHAGVPGRWGPYSLAIVQLDDVPVRILVHVTDAPAGAVQIEGRGQLVMRLVAEREGVPDYSYGFRPEKAPTEQNERVVA